MHEVLVNRLGGLSLPRKSVVRLTDRPDMTLDVYRGRKTTMQQQQQLILLWILQLSHFSWAHFVYIKLALGEGKLYCPLIILINRMSSFMIIGV